MTTYRLQGGCHCGTVRLDVALPRAADAYSPRACDCAFCRKHGAAYLSDPGGTVRIAVRDMHALGRYRQGDALADFLVCKTCGVLVGVAYQEAGRTFATVNVRVVEGDAAFAESKTVSPRSLAADEKIARWKAVWFPDVSLVDSGTTGEAPPLE